LLRLRLDALAEGAQLGLQLRDQASEGFVIALRLRGARLLAETDQRGRALDLAGAGSAEQQLAALHVEHRRIEQGLHIVLVAVDDVGADDRPVQHGEAVVVVEAHLVVREQGDHVDIEHARHLVEVLEAAARAQVGRGNDFDLADEGVRGERSLHAFEHLVLFLFRHGRAAVRAGHEGDADPYRQMQLGHGWRQGRRAAGFRIKEVDDAARLAGAAGMERGAGCEGGGKSGGKRKRKKRMGHL
jgi:hypothetical protein